MEVEVSLAKTKEEIEDALRLVYCSYIKKGYINKNPSRMHIPIWNILPSSYIIIAKCKSNIVGTIVCINDNTFGIPMDRIAVEQIRNLRKQGHKLCELSSLATSCRSSAINVVFSLFRYAFKLGVNYLDISDLIIGVNPSHESFYKRVLQFEHIMSNSIYPSLNNAPVTALMLNIEQVERKLEVKKNIHEFFFKEQKELLKHKVLSEVKEYNELISEGLFWSIIEENNSPVLENKRLVETYHNEWTYHNKYLA